MDQNTEVSKNIIDRRKAAATSHGAAGLAGFLLGMCGSGLHPGKGGPDADLVLTVSTALDRGQTYWSKNSDANQWADAKVVLIDEDTKSPCGVLGSKTGPVYCPSGAKIWIDLSFLRAIDGDLARAYVIAHELGHHVQSQRGELEGRPSVEIELEADCLAGRWMKDEFDQGHLKDGDIAGAMVEAASVGDDRICPTCSIEQWSHGSGEQRMAALARGIGGDTCRSKR